MLKAKEIALVFIYIYIYMKIVDKAIGSTVSPAYGYILISAFSLLVYISLFYNTVTTSTFFYIRNTLTKV